MATSDFFGLAKFERRRSKLVEVVSPGNLLLAQSEWRPKRVQKKTSEKPGTTSAVTIKASRGDCVDQVQHVPLRIPQSSRETHDNFRNSREACLKATLVRSGYTAGQAIGVLIAQL